MKLSVLDRMTVRTGQRTAEALAATLSLARKSDELGYQRYWVTEHHNVPSIGATNPPVLAALVAAHTTRIRVGSGGVMLPHHAPLIVAEQFALLEAYAPGRIDLGLGRASEADPVIQSVLGRERCSDDFPTNVQTIAQLLSPDGAEMLIDKRTHRLLSTPAATTLPEIWLLGSSENSASVAGALGLPYVVYAQLTGSGARKALDAYRTAFRPSALADNPRTMVAMNVVVADTAEEAYALARPQLQRMAFVHEGRETTFMATVEESALLPTTATEDKLVEAMGEICLIDDPANAIKRLHSFADGLGVDEVMISPIASAYHGEDPRRYVARERTLELITAQ